MASPLAPERVRVLSMTWEADGVLSLALVDPEGGPLPLWTPGAHVDLDLAPGLRRSYSLCGDPADERRWQVAVLRETAGRGGSEYVHARLRPGDLLTVGGLRNNFELHPAAWVLIDDSIHDFGLVADQPDGLLVPVDPGRGITAIDPDALRAELDRHCPALVTR